MHQTFYIDIDEEITSIVERLKSARSGEVVIVVPKRALLIQSIVNLRLLKKEADSLGISLSIITQDSLGKVMVEKAGISYQERLDDSQGDEIKSTENKIGEGYFSKPEYQGISASLPGQGKDHIGKIGTESYFSANADGARTERKEPLREITAASSREMDINYAGGEKITNKELVSGITEDIKSGKNWGGIDSTFPVLADDPRGSGGLFKPRGDFSANPNSPRIIEKKPDEIQRNPYQGGTGDKKIDNFFQNNRYSGETAESGKDFKNSHSSKNIHKAFWAFGIAAIFIVAGAAAYLLLPKASVLVSVKTNETVQDAEIRGDVNIQVADYQNEAIPAKLISVTAEVSENINSSGSKSLSSQKARGTITIHNEFSSVSQPLVATTRFESGDGKIFRLEKGITVPGTTIVNGETKPGAIEAVVAADAPGEDYNIAAGKFTIPGFKGNGNGKYDKIYAESSKPMTGGGNSNPEGEKKAITDADINKAKSMIIGKLNDAAKVNIKNSAGSGMVVLDDAINTEDATYTLSNSAGETVDKFNIKGQAKASAIVFSEADLKDMIGKIIAKSGNGKVSLDSDSMAITYGKASSNFDAGTIIIKAHGVIKVIPDINPDDLRKGILGKSNDELGAYMGAYPDVAKVDVTYWPPFMNKKIPLYEKRVEIKIEPADSEE
jgi:hypothetical protein